MNRTKQLMRENGAFERRLDPAFNAVLTDMVVYLRSAPVREYDQELVRRDLGQMFLEAQLRGDRPEDVIGGDYRQFCDQVLEQVPRLTARDRALDALSAAFLYLAVLGAVWLIPGGAAALAAGAGAVPLTIGDLICGVLLLAAAEIIFHWVSRTAFRQKPPSTLAVFLAAAAFFAVLFLLERLLDRPLWLVPLWAGAVWIGACVIVHKLLARLAG